MKFNLGNGSARTDLEVDLPGDYRNGWMHVTLVVDRTAGTVMIAVDFGEFNTLTLPSNLQDISFDSFDHLTIGQDATGTYDASLTASLDEFMIFDGALTEAELAQLAAYYGK